MTDSQFAELDIKLTDSDLDLIKKNGYIDCNCEISVRIKLNKDARKKLK